MFSQTGGTINTYVDGGKIYLDDHRPYQGPGRGIGSNEQGKSEIALIRALHPGMSDHDILNRDALKKVKADNHGSRVHRYLRGNEYKVGARKDVEDKFKKLSPTEKEGALHALEGTIAKRQEDLDEAAGPNPSRKITHDRGRKRTPAELEKQIEKHEFPLRKFNETKDWMLQNMGAEDEAGAAAGVGGRRKRKYRTKRKRNGKSKKRKTRKSRTRKRRRRTRK